jgi:hypothetical protein
MLNNLKRHDIFFVKKTPSPSHILGVVLNQMEGDGDFM